jgi:hypothetical protein
LRDLPDTLRRLILPDLATCLTWLEESGAPYNLLAHVNLVAAAEYLLAAWLNQQVVEVNPVLAHRGGLLRDLRKFSRCVTQPDLAPTMAGWQRCS